MNEVSLSNDLNFIATRIKSHKNNIGYSFIEIGKDLINAKEKEVSHGEWNLFLDEINMSKSQADRHIQIATQHELGKLPNVGNIGFTAMYEIATLPEEKRSEALNEDGSSKSVREIRELKKQNKELEQANRQTESQLKQAQKSNEITQRKLEELEDREPEVIKKEIIKEVVPLSFKEKLESAERKLNFISRENERLQKENDSYQMKDTEKFDEEQAQAELKKLHIEADRNTAEIRIAFKQLNDKVSISKYMYEAISAGSDYEKKRMKEEVEITKEIISSIESSLKNRREIN